MGKESEPEGGQHQLTTIIAQDSVGNPARDFFQHNGSKILTDSKGTVITHINGGAVYLRGIDVTHKVQKGVENIFRYNVLTGNWDKKN